MSKTLDDLYPRPWRVEETWDGPAVVDAKGTRIALVRKNPDRGFLIANWIVAAINAVEDLTKFPEPASMSAGTAQEGA